MAAFTPGAIVADVSRQFEVSTSLIYKWRRQTLVGEPSAAFAPAVLVSGPAPAAPPPDATAITVELVNGTRMKIGAQAPAALVTAALRVLR